MKKILHISHHQGCITNLEIVCSRLGYELETQRADWDYNMYPELASQLWNEYREFYEKFDVIITSDTAPLSRIFLQNDFKGKLIIWGCNRFDYADMASSKGFPDEEYYSLFKAATKNPNIKIFSYTKFEHEYAAKYRNIYWEGGVIRPYIDFGKTTWKGDHFDGFIKKSEVFFIPPYHNDTIFMDLKQKCRDLGISAYGGRYNSASDLIGIKGLIHIPYTWSALALFENWAMGNVYFIPSKEFLLKICQTGQFFWSPPFDKQYLQSSEWYLPEHHDLFIYFDDWEHLKKLTEDKMLIKTKKQLISEFTVKHNEKTLQQWDNACKLW